MISCLHFLTITNIVLASKESTTSPQIFQKLSQRKNSSPKYENYFPPLSCKENVVVNNTISFRDKFTYSPSYTYVISCYECSNNCTVDIQVIGKQWLKLSCFSEEGCRGIISVVPRTQPNHCLGLAELEEESFIPYAEKNHVNISPKKILCYHCTGDCYVYSGGVSQDFLVVECRWKDGCDLKVYSNDAVNRKAHLINVLLVLLVAMTNLE